MSVMVSVGVSQVGMTELIFDMKVNGQQYQSTEGESCKEKQHEKHKENRKYTHTQKVYK